MAEQNVVAFQQVGVSTEKLASYTGSDRLIVINKETRRIHVMDGATAGGIPMARLSDVVDDAGELQYNQYGCETVKDALDKLLYVPMAINSFSNNVGTVEKGSTVTSVTFNWKLNKTPKTLTFNNEPVTATDTSKVLTEQNITQNTTWTLKAIDEKDASATKTTSVNFLNGAYWGVGTVDAEGVNNAFIQGLQKQLTGSKSREITVTAGAGQYIFYAIPTSFGAPTFFVGGFEGGFEKIKTFDYQNASGYTESYDVWRSENANLGKTTVTIK